MKHPSEYFVKYLIARDPGADDASITRTLEEWGMLAPDNQYLPQLRLKMVIPADFQPMNRLHRESMNFLRKEQIHELFYPTAAVEEAWETLRDPQKRLCVEQVLMNRMDLKQATLRINKKQGWFLSTDGLAIFRHFFWNVKLLTFDEWGRFLYGRSAMYERYMGLLTAPPALAMYHLRLEQTLESKDMISRAQEIAHFTLEEIAQKPGTGPDKVKAIGVLTKALVECHEALSTSDMALKDVLKQFQNFRMAHPEKNPTSIHALAPAGNYSRSGAEDEEDEEKELVGSKSKRKNSEDGEMA